MADGEVAVNPLDPSDPLKPGSYLANDDRPQATDQPPLPEDSAMAKAEKVEWNGETSESSVPKRKRGDDEQDEAPPRKKGVAPIRSEYILEREADTRGERGGEEHDPRANSNPKEQKQRKKQKGQNTNRKFGSSRDTLQLCMSRAAEPEFSPKECKFGSDCKYEHDLRKYLKEGKRDDLKTFEVCPVWQARGKCSVGWRCRFASSHSKERPVEDGRSELILIEDTSRQGQHETQDDAKGDEGIGVVNVATAQDRINLGKRKINTPKADEYTKFLENVTQQESRVNNSYGRTNGKHASNGVKGEEPQQDVTQHASNGVKREEPQEDGTEQTPNGVKREDPLDDATKELSNGLKVEEPQDDAAKHASDGLKEEEPQGDATKHSSATTSSDTQSKDDSKRAKAEHRARYVEPAFAVSEKRRLYFGPETPVLAPLTTQGNLPFRRLCVGLGAQVTWSEMAMSLPIIQGQRSEWALMKAHQSELESPRFTPSSKANVIEGYDNARDFRFGAQISANRPWQALKATEVLTQMCPHLRAVDLNCGCPIDLVYRQGAGSALMDSPGKLEKILRGMNAVSGEVPVQAKIRMGTKDNKPTADRLVERLAFGGEEARDLGIGPPGVAAVTLHGRSRQQRYTKMADWSYIAECASLIKGYNKKLNARTDTAKEPDARNMNPSQKMYFIGNGDCYSHVDYFDHIEHAKVDSVMIARGALIKPWIFEEISTGQYLDKSSSERLRYIEQFVRHGLETWGSDEMGVGTTRRFLLEWLSFACRYVPIGLLEHLPPALNDRPPAYRGRDELETLMASSNVRDWIKISEMFLGPAHDNFNFDPKHKSNSYDTGGDYTAEG